MPDFPPIPLLANMTHAQRKCTTLLFDCVAIRDEKERTKIDLNLIFKPIPVRSPGHNYDFYIANRGVDVHLTAEGAKIETYTPSSNLDVTQTASHGSSAGFKFTLGAKISTAEPSKKTVEFLPLESTSGKSEQYTASFKRCEAILSATYMNDAVNWSVSLPRAPGVVRDFLDGNLFLFVVCDWGSTETRAAFLEVRTADVTFFDSKKSPMSATKSLVMWAVLWKRGFHIAFKDGFSSGFHGL